MHHQTVRLTPEWISIGAPGRYTRYGWDAASPDAEGWSTACYVWAHTDTAITAAAAQSENGVVACNPFAGAVALDVALVAPRALYFQVFLAQPGGFSPPPPPAGAIRSSRNG